MVGKTTKAVRWEAPEKSPDHCRHGPLEYIDVFVHSLPTNGSLEPKFVCTKCGAVFFTSKDMSTGNIFTLKFPHTEPE